MSSFFVKFSGTHRSVHKSENFETFEAAQAHVAEIQKRLQPMAISITEIDDHGNEVREHEIRMPKGVIGEKINPLSPPKSTKLPRKLPDDPIARGVAIMREATGSDKDRPSRPT